MNIKTQILFVAGTLSMSMIYAADIPHRRNGTTDVRQLSSRSCDVVRPINGSNQRSDVIDQVNYTDSGKKFFLKDTKIEGNTHITSRQRVVLTGCILSRELTCIAPGCDLSGTSVSGKCTFETSDPRKSHLPPFQLIMRNKSVVHGDIQFVGKAGTIIIERGCTIRGTVNNGTIEHQECI